MNDHPKSPSDRLPATSTSHDVFDLGFPEIDDGAADAHPYDGVVLSPGNCAAQAVDLLKKAIAKGYTGMAHFNTLSCAKSLQRRLDYQALLLAPAAPPAHSPTKFTFDYTFDDPGPRRWMHEGVTWTETQPSGIKHVSAVCGSIVLNGMPGTKLSRMSSAPQTVFVPEVDAGKELRVWVRRGDGTWFHLSPMENVD